MRKTFRGAVFGLSVLACATPAFADDDYIEYPAVRPNYPFKRSCLTDRAYVLPPYDHVFPVRVFTTPQQGPIYNVPGGYLVVSPD